MEWAETSPPAGMSSLCHSGSTCLKRTVEEQTYACVDMHGSGTREDTVLDQLHAFKRERINVSSDGMLLPMPFGLLQERQPNGMGKSTFP